MKEWEVCYTNKGTIYEYCKAWVEAETKEEAIKKVKQCDYLEDEFIDSEYGNDFEIIGIDSVIEINNDN